MYKRNAGRSLTRYKRSRKSQKALKDLPLQVGRYKALAPAFDSQAGRVVYAVKYGSKTKKFFNAENQAQFMLRRQKELEENQKRYEYLYDKFEDQAKEKEKAAKKRRKRKNPSSKEEQFMEFLRNPFDEMFEEDYDIVPNPRRRR